MSTRKHIQDDRPASANGGDYWQRLLDQKHIESILFSGDCGQEQKQQLFYRYVSVVNIEPFNFCNRKCSYCPVSFLDERRGKIKHMSDDIYHKLIAELKQINYSEKLVYNLYNEPLASKKKFYQKLRYALEQLPQARLFFNSNGDYLDLEALQELSEIGVTGINVTLHTKGDYDHQERHQELIEFYDKLEQDLVIDSEDPGFSIHSHFVHNGMRVDVNCMNYEEIGHSRAGAMEHLKITQMRDYPCFRPYRELTVYHNGYVYPCCNIMPDLDVGHKYAIGNLADDNSIYDLYASKLMQGWRKSLLTFGTKKSPCDLCYERTCTVNDDDRQKRQKIFDKIEA
ncbi:radical SAM/SPASM domain-containing protein [Shewanella sp. WXL01]|uniref:radical SAM/SPASM domain-containing protein n=1 Tax=Shewanella sp. WXL01 TaxID=2709721 RepID=UPI0014386496|nr:radical SAM/SPASM domain-containing protein [Shewanella sp. WXL01]NKF51047.1 radical SAM/SPASM domain-containing protein [Shewanella sp. WXL01]